MNRRKRIVIRRTASEAAEPNGAQFDESVEHPSYARPAPRPHARHPILIPHSQRTLDPPLVSPANSEVSMPDSTGEAPSLVSDSASHPSTSSPHTGAHSHQTVFGNPYGYGVQHPVHGVPPSVSYYVNGQPTCCSTFQPSSYANPAYEPPPPLPMLYSYDPSKTSGSIPSNQGLENLSHAATLSSPMQSGSLDHHQVNASQPKLPSLRRFMDSTEHRLNDQVFPHWDAAAHGASENQDPEQSPPRYPSPPTLQAPPFTPSKKRTAEEAGFSDSTSLPYSHHRTAFQLGLPGTTKPMPSLREMHKVKADFERRPFLPSTDERAENSIEQLHHEGTEAISNVSKSQVSANTSRDEAEFSKATPAKKKMSISSLMH